MRPSPATTAVAVEAVSIRDAIDIEPISKGYLSQPAWWCRCGNENVLARGLCRSCYDRRRHSEVYFGGLRDSVLTRDRCCQTCLAESGRIGESRLVVHHRRPGVNRTALHITLCLRCHVRVHRRRQLPGVYSDLFFRLWQEVHPGVPAQLRLPLAA